ncbi:hypothetical protein AgCh_012545 [Apium graveolens]
MLNQEVLKRLPGDSRIYKSCDTICKGSTTSDAAEALYPAEYLNSLKFSGFPNHQIELKIGAPIMLLRNLNPKKGLCNGTRLTVTRCYPFVIEAVIITGQVYLSSTKATQIHYNPIYTPLRNLRGVVEATYGNVMYRKPSPPTHGYINNQGRAIHQPAIYDLSKSQYRIQQKGNHIWAKLRNTQRAYCMRTLEEDGVFIISRVIVVAAPKKFRTVNRDVSLTFFHETKFVRVDDTGVIPKYKFELQDFDTVGHLIGDVVSFIDVIGWVVNYGDIETTHKDGKRLNVELQNDSGDGTKFYLNIDYEPLNSLECAILDATAIRSASTTFTLFNKEAEILIGIPIEKIIDEMPKILLHSDNALNSDLASTVSLYHDNDFSEDDIDLVEDDDAAAATAYDDGSHVSGGRSLLWERIYRRRSRYYISYGVLMANKIPCPPRSGRSYYTHNCYKHKHPANPYTRGCSAITRCRR